MPWTPRKRHQRREGRSRHEPSLPEVPGMNAKDGRHVAVQCCGVVLLARLVRRPHLHHVRPRASEHLGNAKAAADLD